MATSTAFNVGKASPTLLGTGLGRVIIQNVGNYYAYIGDSGVTDQDGIRLAPSGDILAPLVALTTLETVYAICDSSAPSGGTTQIRVLKYLG